MNANELEIKVQVQRGMAFLILTIIGILPAKKVIF